MPTTPPHPISISGLPCLEGRQGPAASVRETNPLRRRYESAIVFFFAARFSLRRCLSVFWGAFFCSFFGFSEPFIYDLLGSAETSVPHSRLSRGRAGVRIASPD